MARAPPAAALADDRAGPPDGEEGERSDHQHHADTAHRGGAHGDPGLGDREAPVGAGDADVERRVARRPGLDPELDPGDVGFEMYECGADPEKVPRFASGMA